MKSRHKGGDNNGFGDGGYLGEGDTDVNIPSESPNLVCGSRFCTSLLEYNIECNGADKGEG